MNIDSIDSAEVARELLWIHFLEHSDAPMAVEDIVEGLQSESPVAAGFSDIEDALDCFSKEGWITKEPAGGGLALYRAKAAKRADIEKKAEGAVKKLAQWKSQLLGKTPKELVREKNRELEKDNKKLKAEQDRVKGEQDDFNALTKAAADIATVGAAYKNNYPALHKRRHPHVANPRRRW